MGRRDLRGEGSSSSGAGILSLQEGMLRASLRGFPFAVADPIPIPAVQIPYLYFTDAMDLAREQGKLVHFVLLWGALDDQSC